MPFTRLHLLAILCAGMALLRFGIHGADDLRTSVRAHLAEGTQLIPIPGDVQVRDLPRAYKLRHGGIFEDAHYLDEVTWYPSARPAITALTSWLTGSGVVRSYYKSDLVLQGLTVIGAFVLMGAALGRVGIVALALAMSAGWMSDLESASLYPGESSRFALFCSLGLLSWVWSKQRDTDASVARYGWAGGLSGLLCLWKGSDFVVSAFTLGVVMIRECLIHGASRSGLVVRRLAAVAVPFAVFTALFLVPPVLRYGHLAEPESARLWLNPSWFNGGAAAGEMFRLALLPREPQTLLLVPFAAGLFDRRLQGRFWPLAIAALLCTALAHLGFVVNDVAHPMLRGLARSLLRAPPSTFWLWMLFQFIELIGATWVVVSFFRWCLGDAEGVRHRRDLAANAAVVFAAVLMIVRPIKPTPIPGVTIPLSVARFARECSKVLGRKAVITDSYELAALADLYMFWMPFRDHTNHYVQQERDEARQALHRAIDAQKYAEAKSILDRYSVGGFVERGESTALSRSCGGRLLIPPTDYGFALRAYSGQCAADAVSRAHQ